MTEMPNYYVIWVSGHRHPGKDPDAYICANNLETKLQACGWQGQKEVPGTIQELDTMLNNIPDPCGKLLIYTDDQVHLINQNPSDPGLTDIADNVYPLNQVGNSIKDKFGKAYVLLLGPASGLGINDLISLSPPDPAHPVYLITSMAGHEHMVLDEFDLASALDGSCDIMTAVMQEQARLDGIQTVLIRTL